MSTPSHRAGIAALAFALSLANISLATDAPTPPAAPAPDQGAKPGSKPADHTTPRDTQHYNITKDTNAPAPIAAKGYDVVAYFPEGGAKPAKGDDRFTHIHRGVLYRFASEANRARFIANPEKYEPAYGGWCASAMADGGRKVDIDPKAFKITNGRLFLFYTDLFNDARTFWNKDEPTRTHDADDAWKKLTGEEPRKPTAPTPGEQKKPDAPADEPAKKTSPR